MLREKAEKIVKAIFAGVTMALCVAAINPATQVQASMLEESEPNNTPAMANQLELNTWLKGKSKKSGDEDWYQFTVPQKGRSQIFLQRGEDNPKANARWKFYLQDGGRHQLFTASGYTIESYKLGLAPGKYYIKVVPVGSVGTRDTYKLGVNYKASDEWENEIWYKNKNEKNPNIVMTNKKYTGNLYCTNDKDWYQFRMNGINGAVLKFTVDDEVSVPGKWKIQFIEAKSNDTLKSVRIAESGNINKNLSKFSQIVSSEELLRVAKCNGDIIVRVSNSNKAVGKMYHLELIPAISSVNNVSGSSSLNQIYLRWDYVNGATGYEIYRKASTRSDYRKIATVTGNTYTDINVVKDKSYYYKVVAIQNGVAADPSAYVRIKVRQRR